MKSNGASPEFTPGLGLALLCLLGVLTVCFWKGLLPEYVQFSNDAPLGAYSAEWIQLPQSFTGAWVDLNSVGFGVGVSTLIPSNLLRMVLGPLWYSKVYPPITLFFLGFCAWVMFRAMKFSPAACLLGSLATALNSDYFSVSCWGVGTQAVAFGFCFLAVAALTNDNGRSWIKTILAGLAVGLAIAEGLDNGAIFSLFIAAYALYRSLLGDGATATRFARGIARVAVVALFAAFMAAQTLSVLIGTQIKGVAGTQQDPAVKAARWDWATQWSLPKREALGLIVPGLFGFRMDTPEGGNYWGAVGRDPALDRYYAQGSQGDPPSGFMRFTGGGIYGGVTVIFLAVWAVCQSFRRKGSPFQPNERKLIWFWSGIFVIALLLAFGRFAPFYQFFYALPYFSTIRNPAKFVHVLSWALVVLFAYGIEGLWRQSQSIIPSRVAGDGFIRQLKSWWHRTATAPGGTPRGIGGTREGRDSSTVIPRGVSRFDRRWTLGVVAVLTASFMGWLIYSSAKADLVAYLQTVQFDERTAQGIARFSIGTVGWYLLFLALAAGAVTLILSGVPAPWDKTPRQRGGGSGTDYPTGRAGWGMALVGLLLTVDLVRANQPWIIYWDYQHKYATNPIIEILRQNPHEQRVAILPLRFPPPHAPSVVPLDQLYRIEWAQHLFLYHNIQSLDVVQMPRMPADLAAFEGALSFRGGADSMHLLTRRWQLTNTRYLLAPYGFLEVLNQQLDPVDRRFRALARFEILAKPDVVPSELADVTAVPDPNGQFALIEYGGALPRAKLYSNWRTGTNASATVQSWVKSLEGTLPKEMTDAIANAGTNGQAVLFELADKSFDPSRTVLLEEALAVTPATGTNLNPGTVTFESYSPTRIVLKANAETPAILLLNDKYDPNWRVTVDGKPAELLRCNFLMRGVQLDPGEHVVEFSFEPLTKSVYVSIAGMVLGLLLLGWLAVTSRRAGTATPTAPASAPRLR